MEYLSISLCHLWFLSLVSYNYLCTVLLSPFQFSHSVMSNSLWPHEAQHISLPSPSPTPGVHPHMSIESVMPSNHLILCHPLLLLPSIIPSIRVFSSELALHIRWLGTEASASASVFLMKILGWFPLGLTGWISLQSKYSQVSSPASQFKNISSFALSQLPHPYMTTGKTIVWLCRPLSEQWCLCFLICYLSFS